MSIAEDMVKGRICRGCQLPFSQENGFPAWCEECWDPEESPEEEPGSSKSAYPLHPEVQT